MVADFTNIFKVSFINFSVDIGVQRSEYNSKFYNYTLNWTENTGYFDVIVSYDFPAKNKKIKKRCRLKNCYLYRKKMALGWLIDWWKKWYSVPSRWQGWVIGLVLWQIKKKVVILQDSLSGDDNVYALGNNWALEWGIYRLPHILKCNVLLMK